MQEKLAPTQLEDTEVILAAPGEMVVPPVVSESTQAAINADLQSVGLNPNDFVVGNGRINQITGLQQFGFLSDVFKKVKKVVKKAAKVVKKAAPVVLAASIPGVGGAMSKGLAGLTGLFKKEAGQSGIGLVEDFLKGKESDPVREGGFLDVPTPKPIKGIEDVIKGQQTSDSFGGLAALAALYGLATKKAAEKTEGGLTDIRASRRPDLVAQPVFQGFDVGIRPGMAKGGLSPELFELDFRKVGGPTIGIGTGTSDDIPAMLSDGEYVMTADANNGAGGFKISKTTDSITLIPDGKPNREKGAKNLGMLMDMFEDANKRMA